MEWKDLAGVVGGLAPALGGALFGPLGSAAGQVLSNVLGVENKPEAVAEAIATDPEAPAKLATADTDWKKTLAEAGKAQVEQVNETMRAEVAAGVASGDGWLGKWRGAHAWELTLECPVWAFVMVYAIVWDKAGVADLVQASGLIMAYWAARFGVLGVHVWQGSNERQAALGGGVPGVIANIVKAIKK